MEVYPQCGKVCWSVIYDLINIKYGFWVYKNLIHLRENQFDPFWVWKSQTCNTQSWYLTLVGDYFSKKHLDFWTKHFPSILWLCLEIVYKTFLSNTILVVVWICFYWTIQDILLVSLYISSAPTVIINSMDSKYCWDCGDIFFIIIM